MIAEDEGRGGSETLAEASEIPSISRFVIHVPSKMGEAGLHVLGLVLQHGLQ